MILQERSESGRRAYCLGYKAGVIRVAKLIEDCVAEMEAKGHPTFTNDAVRMLAKVVMLAVPPGAEPEAEMPHGAVATEFRTKPPPTSIPHSHGMPIGPGIPACPGPPRCMAGPARGGHLPPPPSPGPLKPPPRKP